MPENSAAALNTQAGSDYGRSSSRLLMNLSTSSKDSPTSLWGSLALNPFRLTSQDYPKHEVRKQVVKQAPGNRLVTSGKYKALRMVHNLEGRALTCRKQLTGSPLLETYFSSGSGSPKPRNLVSIIIASSLT